MKANPNSVKLTFAVLIVSIALCSGEAFFPANNFLIAGSLFPVALLLLVLLICHASRFKANRIAAKLTVLISTVLLLAYPISFVQHMSMQRSWFFRQGLPKYEQLIASVITQSNALDGHYRLVGQEMMSNVL